MSQYQKKPQYATHPQTTLGGPVMSNCYASLALVGVGRTFISGFLRHFLQYPQHPHRLQYPEVSTF